MCFVRGHRKSGLHRSCWQECLPVASPTWQSQSAWISSMVAQDSIAQVIQWTNLKLYFIFWPVLWGHSLVGETDLQPASLVCCGVLCLSANLSVQPDITSHPLRPKSWPAEDPQSVKHTAMAGKGLFPLRLQLICYDFPQLSPLNLRPSVISYTLIHLFFWSDEWISLELSRTKSARPQPLGLSPAGLAQKLQRMLFEILGPLLLSGWLCFKKVPTTPVD